MTLRFIQACYDGCILAGLVWQCSGTTEPVCSSNKLERIFKKWTLIIFIKHSMAMCNLNKSKETTPTTIIAVNVAP